MTASVARPYHTLDHHLFNKSTGRRKCRCCPYGYHIDIDFVRYCESISSSQLLSDLPIKKQRWNIRKRRASKESLLGIAALPQLEENTTKASNDVGDDLQKAVLDFEKVLTNTTNRKSNSTSKFNEWQIPKNNSNYEDNYKKFKSKLLDNKDDTNKMTSSMIQDDFGINIHGTTNDASPHMLQSIRKQMVTSLGRIRQLEDTVKIIPNLQAHITNLEKENEKLNDLLKQEQNIKIIPSVVTADASTATAHLHGHTRNIGIGCTVMTRDVGITTGIIRTASCGTDPHNIKQINDNDNKLSSNRPCLISLENIIGNTSRVSTKNVATSIDRSFKANKDAITETDLKFKKILTEDDLAQRLLLKNEFEKKSQKNVSSIGIVTDLKKDNLFSKEEMEIFIEKNIKENKSKKVNTVNVAEQTNMNLKTEIKDNSTQTMINSVDIGISTKIQMFDKSSQIIRSTRDFAVSNHTINDVCHKCNDLRKINATTQCNIENDQHKLNNIYKRTLFTDTCDLIIYKDQSMNTSKKKLVNTGVDVCLLNCAKCDESKINENINEKPTDRINKRPSYLPIPTNTTNKSQIPTVTSASPKNNIRIRNEDYESESGSDDGGYNIQNDDTRISSSLSRFHPIQPKSYKKEPSKEMKGALKVLNDSLQKYSSDNFPKHMRNAINIVQQEWFKISSVADANPLIVEDYLDCFEEISGSLLEYIVNMTDVTGNTAMHYAVSNGNFDVVSILLDSKVCNINKMNTAGYTCIMLVALTKVRSETDRQVVRRLFHMADVNIRAKQHGQTALMLAVSHGRIDTVELLLGSGADINIQDEDGSTALMCAAEHGYIDIVKLLLTQPDCDLTITDYDGSTALGIAMDAGNRDIGVLLYAQEHFSRGNSPFTPLKSHRRAKSATPTLRSATPIHSPQNEHPN